MSKRIILLGWAWQISNRPSKNNHLQRMLALHVKDKALKNKARSGSFSYLKLETTLVSKQPTNQPTKVFFFTLHRASMASSASMQMVHTSRSISQVRQSIKILHFGGFSPFSCFEFVKVDAFFTFVYWVSVCHRIMLCLWILGIKTLCFVWFFFVFLCVDWFWC